jgi:tRNA pseudouridine55 synthase
MTSAERPRPPSGVLVVDKPAGCTSHDVVSWARRVFSTREVGHAGTLDPMATGVLVVLIGEATKLSSWVTSEDKDYEAELAWGVETDSLDADGAVTRVVEGATPTVERAAIEAEAMVGAMAQVPPVVSAIKVGGVASHERARRGEAVELAARDVLLRAVRVTPSERADRARVALSVSKGFYVRSFARDLAARLGTVAHLTALRRTRSGAFTVDEAVDGASLREARADSPDGAAREAVRARLVPLARLESKMPCVRVDEPGARALWMGKVLTPEGPSTARPEGEGEVLLALLDRSALGLPPQPVGLVERVGEALVPRRNFAPPEPAHVWQRWLDGPPPAGQADGLAPGAAPAQPG